MIYATGSSHSSLVTTHFNNGCWWQPVRRNAVSGQAARCTSTRASTPTRGTGEEVRWMQPCAHSATRSGSLFHNSSHLCPPLTQARASHIPAHTLVLHFISPSLWITTAHLISPMHSFDIVRALLSVASVDDICVHGLFTCALRLCLTFSMNTAHSPARFIGG